MCKDCKRDLVTTAVPGFSAGQECYGCDKSSTGSVSVTVTGTAAWTETAMKISDSRTVSLANQPNASSLPTSVEGIASSTPPITPTPFSGVVGNTPYGPASALPTYVTAGSARSVVCAGVVGSALMVVVGVLAL